jgi:hypothetical protein
MLNAITNFVCLLLLLLLFSYQLTIIKGSTLPYKHELEALLLMLTGDEKQIIKSATNWLEALIGVLVLCRPLAGRSLVG